MPYYVVTFDPGSFLAPGSVTTDGYSYGTSNNRLASIAEAGGHTRAFTYDAAGNVTYDNRSGGGYGYAYDAAGRMATFSINGVVQANYRYNALGQQEVRQLTQAGQTLHAVHDMEGNRIAEYGYNTTTGASTLIRQYIWLAGRAVAVVEGSQIYFIRTDHIGRPVFATNNLGVKVWEASYLPFGGVHVATGGIALRFPGQWFQAESGLHQNWMRDYDPTTGRYLQADPLGLVDGPSVYGYVRQNPGRWVDPRGEYCTEYTGKDGNTYIKCKGPTTYCIPGEDCAWRDPIENNPEYDQCMDSCELSYNDLVGGPGGLICGAVVGFGEYCGGPVGAMIGASICYPMHVNVLCRKKCGY